MKAVALKREWTSLEKIVSGGQTGVDRAALDAALSIGLDCGGWCPRGRRADDGAIPAFYRLTETPERDYTQRTEWNVRDSDATLILCRGKPTGGTAMTVQFAKAMHKPFYFINLLEHLDTVSFCRWLEAEQVKVLNVAGPREDNMPGIYRQTLMLLLDLLAK